MVDCKENVRNLRIAWSVILLIGIATIAVSGPVYMSNSTVVNVAKIVTIALTIASLYICYRFFSLKFVRNKIKDEKSLQKYMRCRFIILYFTFAIATLIYCVSLSQSIHLCILFTVLLFSQGQMEKDINAAITVIP